MRKAQFDVPGGRIPHTDKLLSRPAEPNTFSGSAADMPVLQTTLAFSCSKLRFVYFSCLSGIYWVMNITADKGHFPLSRGRFMQVDLPFGVD